MQICHSEGKQHMRRPRIKRRNLETSKSSLVPPLIKLSVAAGKHFAWNSFIFFHSFKLTFPKVYS